MVTLHMNYYVKGVKHCECPCMNGHDMSCVNMLQLPGYSIDTTQNSSGACHAC